MHIFPIMLTSHLIIGSFCALSFFSVLFAIFYYICFEKNSNAVEYHQCDRNRNEPTPMRNGDNLSDKELIGDDDIAIEVDSSPMGGYSSSSSIFEDSDVLISDQESFISLEDAQNACLKTVSLANVRYVSTAVVIQTFHLQESLMPHKFKCGDIITFKDIALGYFEGLKDIQKRQQIIADYFIKHEKVSCISNRRQIFQFIDFLIRIVIRARYNSSDTQFVQVRSQENIQQSKNESMKNVNNKQKIENERKPITDWIWRNKMKKRDMDVYLFVCNFEQWMKEV